MARPNWPIICPAAVVVIATMWTTPAAAQSNVRRIEISANVGALSGSSTFTESEAYPVNAETETITVAHGSQTAIAFNVGGAVLIVPKLWIGVQYAMANTKADASLTASVPHPLLFNAPRMVQGTVNGVAHNEQNVHVDLMYSLPIRVVDVRVMGGPTVFTLKQDFVSSVAVNETYPFDTATFASAQTTRLSKTALGLNAGVDISRSLSPLVGIGALIRYSHGNTKFDSGGVTPQTVKVGGVEATAGVRIRF